MANTLADKLNKRKQKLPTLEKIEAESALQDINLQNFNQDTHRAKLDAGWKRVATILPPEEHQEFKIAALKEGRDMSDIIRDLVKEWLQTLKHSRT